jgi:hypothetical protein
MGFFRCKCQRKFTQEKSQKEQTENKSAEKSHKRKIKNKTFGRLSEHDHHPK